MWPGKLFGLGFKSCWQLSFGFETRSNLQYFLRKHMTSYDIIWLCPSSFNLGLVDNKPEVVDRFRTWQFEGLLKRLHHERVHLRFGWLKDSGMKVTGVFGWFLDDFGWFCICCVDFANGSGFAHDAKFLCQELQLDLKISWFFERWRQLWGKHSWSWKWGFPKGISEFQGSISWGSMLIFRDVLYNMTLMVCMMNLQSTQYSNKMFDQVHTAILVAVAVIIHRNASEKGNQSSSQSWMRYCARLQLALLQNVEDNLVRQQAELDLVNHPVLFQ